LEGKVFDEYLACGDGKACTDYFSGQFAEVIVSFLADEFFPGDLDAKEEMLAGITRAWIVLPDGSLMFQRRGQFMASDFSFPILNWVSFLAHLEAEKLVEDLLRMPLTEFKAFISEYDRCGVNGDDICSSSPDPQSGVKWEEGFRSVGGVASIAKSPFGREFATINSQLLRRTPDNRLKVIPVLLPAMVERLSSKSHLVSDEKWRSFYSAPTVTPETIRSLELDLIGLPDVPRLYGGLGFARPAKEDELYLRRVRWSMLVKRDEGDFSLPSTKLLTREGSKTWLLPVAKAPLPDTVTGFIPRQVKDQLVRAAFGHPKAVEWKRSNAILTKPSWPRRLCQIDCVPKIRERLDDAWWADSEGLVYVQRLPCEDRSVVPFVAPAIKPFRTTLDFISRVPKRPFEVDEPLGPEPLKGTLPWFNSAEFWARFYAGERVDLPKCLVDDPAPVRIETELVVSDRVHAIIGGGAPKKDGGVVFSFC